MTGSHRYRGFLLIRVMYPGAKIYIAIIAGINQKVLDPLVQKHQLIVMLPNSSNQFPVSFGEMLM